MPHIQSICAEPRALTHAELAAHRAEIDRIDEALLSLIETRLARADAIARLKEKEQVSSLLLRPERERSVLERLSGRAAALPKPAVRSIWRELMGLSLQAQRRTELVVCAPNRPILVADGARLRFGCQAPMLAADTAEEALERARTREAVAVIELSPTSSWWTALAGDGSLAIFDCLTDHEGRVTALLVGRVSGEDQVSVPTFPILTEAALRRRMDEGEAIRPLAIAGPLRLCIAMPKPGKVGE